MQFEYGTVSVRGKSHIEDDLPNQDYIQGHSIGETVILVAADGAGSAARSEEGSRRIVNKVLDNLKKFKNKEIFTDPYEHNEEFQRIILESIEEIRTNLLEDKKEEFDLINKKKINLADLFSNVGTKVVRYFSKTKPYQKTITVVNESDDNVELKQDLSKSKSIQDSVLVDSVETKLSDYASTFLLIINSPLSTFTAHIGDGYIVGWKRKLENSDTQNQIISLPRNGEYDNETYFFTMEDWKKNIRFYYKKETYDACLIMSDGADKFWIGSDRKTIALPLFESFIKIREKHKDKDLSNILENVFTFEKISKVDTDDATIGMILR